MLSLSISIFRSLWILRCIEQRGGWGDKGFQSPFSGAFESYSATASGCTCMSSPTFNLHFQEPLNLTISWLIKLSCKLPLSISIFRSLWILLILIAKRNGSLKAIFQSPFSGAFESYCCYLSRHPTPCTCLSISIFRSLWILLINVKGDIGQSSWLSISIFRSLWILRIGR